MEKKLHLKMEDRGPFPSLVFPCSNDLLPLVDLWGKWADEMAMKNRTRFAAFALIVAIGLVSWVLLQPGAVKAGGQADEAAAARHEYTENIAARYNYRFGKELPFVPSNAMTDT
ncbi:MAG: tetratricopeptide repeat protein, partial [Bryobacterales bacterium]|nr:tetratricopeptide repeat protein [Bryobacterales bacterium]